MATPDFTQQSLSQDEPTAQDVANANRKILSRRGHTKSRRGCVTCKRRRVKCPEDTPICRHCERLGLACQYGDPIDLMAYPSAPLRSTGAQFSIRDFQLFHHFLLHAYPPLPLQGKAIWDGVSQVSHEFDFLIHAMLGLSATHLDLCRGSESYKMQALSHRTIAIARVSKAMNSLTGSSAQGDALYAALLVLAFQSSYMADGMLEILPMIRGCMMILKSGKVNLSLFRQFTIADHEESAQEIIQSNPARDNRSIYLGPGLESLRAIRPLCQTELEIEYFDIVEEIIVTTSRSQSVSFFKGYNVFNYPTQSEFNDFLRTDNYVSQLLMVHFFIAEYAVAWKRLPSVLDSMRFKGDVIRAWVTQLENALPVNYKRYIAWPMEYMATEFYSNSSPHLSIESSELGNASSGGFISSEDL